MKENNHHFDLPYHADCLEVFDILNQHDFDHKRVGIAVGMYQLQQPNLNDSTNSTQEVAIRKGGIALFAAKIQIEDTDSGSPRTLISVKPETFLNDQYGILDTRYMPHDNELSTGSLFSVCSDCALRHFYIDTSPDDSLSLSLKSTISAFQDKNNPNSVGLCMDIFQNAHSNTVGFSCSDGSSTIVQDFQVKIQWKAHDLEIWSISFNPHSLGGNLIVTGADDCSMRFWDLRTDLKKPYSINSKTHPMGVTCVTHYPLDSNIIFTGSYDEKVRIWDARAIQAPLETLKSSGGIWRMKFKEDFLLIAACDGGAEIWKTDGPTRDFNKISTYSGHDSLVYGIGLLNHSSNPNSPSWAASCSFYDHNMQIWSF